MSVEKRRKTMTPDVVPGLGDPDRKRVLNVLAQRRYRMAHPISIGMVWNERTDANLGQRRKEKLAELEARTNAAAAPTREGTGPSSDSSSSPSEQWQDVGVEEVVVQSAAIDFQGLEYNPAVMDMSTFAAADFGKINFRRLARCTMTVPKSLFAFPVISIYMFSHLYVPVLFYGISGLDLRGPPEPLICPISPPKLTLLRILDLSDTK
jgi:hypothetical protein